MNGTVFKKVLASPQPTENFRQYLLSEEMFQRKQSLGALKKIVKEKLPFRIIDLGVDF